MLVAEANGPRSIRLRGHDYSHPGAYFVTVCAARRELLFGWISDGRVVENGSIVRDCWLDLPNHYPHVSLDTFVVMPDHIHGIIVLLDADGVGSERAGSKSDADNAGASSGWGAGSARAGLKPAPTGGGASADVGGGTGCLRSCGRWRRIRHAAST